MISRFEAFVATLLLVTVAFGPTKHAKRRGKFQSKIDGIPFHHLLSRLSFVYFVCFVG
jgi:hypothetical protein